MGQECIVQQGSRQRVRKQLQCGRSCDRKVAAKWPPPMQNGRPPGALLPSMNTKKLIFYSSIRLYNPPIPPITVSVSISVNANVSIFNLCLQYPISRVQSPVSCLLSPVSCLLSRVSGLLSPVSCLLCSYCSYLSWQLPWTHRIAVRNHVALNYLDRGTFPHTKQHADRELQYTEHARNPLFMFSFSLSLVQYQYNTSIVLI